jgi:multimeric flavodoxin WrbA
MYALAINGSPRKGGNTETLLTKVLEPLKDAGWKTELVQVGGKNFRGCMACFKCVENKNQQCSVKNDGFNDVMAKMIDADALILGTPTYFAALNSDIKALIDRSGFVALANGGLFRGKIGAAVVAVRRAGATHAFDSINHMYMMSQMIVPGSTYWNLGMGMNKGEVNNDPEGLNNMLNLGETIAWLGKAMAPHMESFPINKAPAL